MSVTINLIFWGDTWCNYDEVIAQLSNVDITEPVIIHTQHEGVSLKSSGVIEALDRWISDTNRLPGTVTVNTPNQYEKINYKFDNTLSTWPHFFKPSRLNYHRDISQIDTSKKLFGLFLGRYNKMRNTIANDVVNNYQYHFLISIMKADRLNAISWWDSKIKNIGSLDAMSIDDQYNDHHNTNQSLLNFYNEFQIELAVETVTRGESFFPTEKSIRPIMGSKPFITYATIDFLKNIKELGFRTFSELWSEDYDQFEGIKRWERIKSVIADIIEQGYDCNLATEIVKYNYDHLQTIIHDNKNL
jgi:hypothetical protein